MGAVGGLGTSKTLSIALDSFLSNSCPAKELTATQEYSPLYSSWTFLISTVASL